MDARFPLCNFSGTPVAYYRVQSEGVKPTPKPVSAPGHHIIIADVSGSMYYDLQDLKATIEKLLTLEEFNDPNLKSTLITYSSSGDVITHFHKVTVAEVMATNSPHLQEIRRLRVRGLTCISQALKAAAGYVEDDETTAISLHSDGYANDRSPSMERREIQEGVDALKAHPAVFVNTVAYRQYADFNMLANIANQLSGSCLQVNGIREVYLALHDTTALLRKGTAQVIEAGIGSADYVAFVSASAKKSLGSSDSIQIKGISPDDVGAVFRYFEIPEEEYNALKTPVCGVDADDMPILAFSRAMISEGSLNKAKFGLVATRDPDLLSNYSRALVGSEVAAMAQGLDTILFGDTSEGTNRATQDFYGIATSGPSLLTLLGVLNKHASSLRVNIPQLMSTYKRRGLKRVAGVRQEDGSIKEPRMKKSAKGDSTWVHVTGFDVNRNTATVNMKTRMPINLRDRETNEVISEVSGIALDNLHDYKQYTLVGDGEITTPQVPFKTSSKKLYKELMGLGLVEGEFNPKDTLFLNIGELPLVDFDQSFALPEDTYGNILRLTVAQKILNGVLKEASEDYTKEQITELKEHYLSASLYVNFPTTNTYTDLKAAISEGKVDTRLSYKIDVGNTAIVNASKLKTGNAYLQRRFSFLDADCKAVKKPSLPMFLEGGTWGVKALTARTKLDAVDELSYSLYEDFLGLGHTGAWDDTLELAGVPADVRVAIMIEEGDTLVEALGEAQRSVSKALDAQYAKFISPLAFYVGSTGLIPDEFDVPALTADKLQEKYPALKLSKAEKEEGTFFVLPDEHVITVFIKGEHFSTGR